jgi:hypothetical protein
MSATDATAAAPSVAALQSVLGELAAQVAEFSAVLDAVRAQVDALSCPVATHDHTADGRCICPACGLILAGNLAGDYRLRHLRSPHERCPDCGGLYVGLAGHRVRAHP